MFRKQIAISALALGMAFSGSAYAATQNFHLGFIMDESGSVDEDDYLDAMDSLAAALSASIPLATAAVSYEITVVSFSTAARVVVAPTVINNGTDMTNVFNAISGDAYNGGSTCYACAMDLMRTTVTSLSGAPSETGILNMMTDGNNNTGGSASTASLALRTAGWDSLSFESVEEFGSGPDNAALAALGFDTTTLAGTIGGIQILGQDDAGSIVDPLNKSFVLPVSAFGAAYNQAIATKVQKIITPGPSPVPVPAALPLMAGGLSLLGLLGGWRRRRPAA